MKRRKKFVFFFFLFVFFFVRLDSHLSSSDGHILKGVRADLTLLHRSADYIHHENMPI